jgi:hypothetical protein
MKVSAQLDELYRGYYTDAVAEKRAIAARQTTTHILRMLTRRPYASALDVGAGEGAVLAELEACGFAAELHALEISPSGIEAIRARRLRTLKTLRQFDGYRIDPPDGRASVAIAIHVLEHVEHERAFLRALLDAADEVYVEVPLEHTAGIDRAIRIGRPYGHINFYTRESFRNLLETSGAEVTDLQVFPNSLAYERFLGGNAVGSAKYLVRSNLLRMAPRLAQRRMTYLAGAVCRRAASGAAG